VIISLNSINQLIFVVIMCCVFFEVKIEYLNIIKTSLCFEGLMARLVSATVVVFSPLTKHINMTNFVKLTLLEGNAVVIME
jgi:hypothetical protein